MKTLLFAGFAGLLAIGMTGCGNSSAPAGAGTTTAAGASSATAANQVPTEEDFEDKAETTITPATAEQELNKLDKEIGQ